ncbi:MAG TPA: NAD-dependent epimerase/dehydratase family protein [Candidatus Marinimicrobia bacterium]|nr:NAD-dependent epimerase/dehydratase family protein [Candidatus Neomarinimicrobiota bacterium]
MKEKKILLTGAAGFIGFHLCRKILECGHTVIGIDILNNYYDPKLKEDRLSLILPETNFHFHKCDITDISEMTKIFAKERPEIIIHLAAQAGVRYSLENPFAYEHSNGAGFLTMIELSRRFDVENFLYASSSSVYGIGNKVPYSVSDPVEKPISFYAATKRANELTAHVYHHLYGLPVTGFRFFTVYGPWGRPDMAYYKFVKAIIEGKAITVYNQGNMKRDFTYVDDIVAGLYTAIDKPFPYQIFNLGNHRSENLLDMIQIIEDLLGQKAIINWEPMQPGDVYETYADIQKTQEILNFRPTTNLREGLEKFVQWYLEYNK